MAFSTWLVIALPTPAKGEGVLSPLFTAFLRAAIFGATSFRFSPHQAMKCLRSTFGYGDSDKPSDADLGIQAQSEIIFQALSALGWKRATIVGHDIGGGIAQLVAINHPEILDRLVLIDSILYDSFPEPGIARLKEPVWDEILGAANFDLKKGLAKGFHEACSIPIELPLNWLMPMSVRSMASTEARIPACSGR